MNFNITYEHLSKLEIIVAYIKIKYRTEQKSREGIFLKTYSREFSGIHELEFQVALPDRGHGNQRTAKD